MSAKTPSWVIPSKPKNEDKSAVDNVGDVAGVTVHALTPYATMATTGALVGGATLGPPGALIGAAGGPVALTLADLATLGINAAITPFGNPAVPYPSQSIQNLWDYVGVGKKPDTAAQQVYSDTLEAATGAGLTAKGIKTFIPLVRSPTAKNVMTVMSQSPKAQIAAASGGAALPSTAANYFDTTNPYALFGLSLLGSILGGKAASPKTKIPTTEQVATSARQNYQAAEAAGVRFGQPALSQLGDDMKQRLASVQYDPGTQPQVRKWLGIFDKNFKGPISFEKLDALHSDIMAEARTVTNNRTRMMLRELGNSIDDFITKADASKVVAGNPAAATTALERARGLWKAKAQMELLDKAATTARNRAQQSGGAFIDRLKTEYQKILNNTKVFSRLTPEVQAAVRDVANGTKSSRAWSVLGKLSPTNRNALWLELMGGGGAYAATQHPGVLIASGGAAAAGLAGKTVANALTKRQVATANRLAAAPAMPTPGGPGWYLLSPAAQQAALSNPRGQNAEDRRGRTAPPPSWVLRAK